MKNDVYNRQGIDLWRLTLVIAGKLWIILVSAIAGCLAGAGLYKLYISIKYPVPEYRISADYYITFNFDEFEHGDDYYNAYTWDGILRDNPLVDSALTILPDEITKEMVKSSVTGEMLGDYRILTVHVTGENQEYVEKIARAYEEAMVNFGNEEPLFEKIELWSMEEPEILRKDMKIINAALLGGFIFFLGSAFILLYYYLLLDAFYTERDLRERFCTVFGVAEIKAGIDENNHTSFTTCAEVPMKVLGIRTKEENAEEERLLSANLKLLFGEEEKYLTIDGTVFPKENEWVELKEKPVVITIPFGKNVGRKVERNIANMKQNGCHVAGAILVDVDDKFLKRYYKSF